jgi:16S rRNA (uracil1498-N3)-methyltransferase
MSLPRFHVPEAAPGARVELPDESAHHAREVLRLRAGAAVRIFDGSGNEYDAVLDRVSRDGISVRLGHRVETRPESPLRLILALSPLKGDLMEVVIQKATELGVAEIRPVVTIRTDAVARPALKGTRQERWEKVARGAAEQCGRSVVPTIAPTTTLDHLIAGPAEGARIVLWEEPGLVPLVRLPRPDPAAALVLVGPAGGWEASEIRRLEAAGFHLAGLGPRVLRSETAAIAAIAVLQAVWGDLGTGLP